MGFVTKTITRTRKTVAQQLPQNTIKLDSASNKGTVQFSSSLIDNLQLADNYVAVYIGDDTDSPFFGRAFVVVSKEYGRRVKYGKLINAALFVDTLRNYFEVDDSQEEFLVEMETTPTINSDVASDPINMYELSIYEEEASDDSSN